MATVSTLITPECTGSYLHLFKAVLGKNPKPTDKPSFNGVLLFTAAALETPEWKAMQAALIAACRERWGAAKADAMIREDSIRLPFRKDVTAKGYPAEFVRFINVKASEENPPQVVSRFKGPDGKPLPITDRKEIYAGCKLRVSLGVYAYGGLPGDTYSPGVAFGLRNVQKIGDGPRLDSRTDAGDDFTATDDAPATGGGGDDLAALMS